MPNLARVTPLMSAAFDGHVAVMRLLLERGAATEPIDQVDKTAMVYAAGAGHADCVGVLLDAGVDINARYRHQLTALMWAAASGAFPPSICFSSAGPTWRRATIAASARSTSRRTSTRATSFAGLRRVRESGGVHRPVVAVALERLGRRLAQALRGARVHTDRGREAGEGVCGEAAEDWSAPPPSCPPRSGENRRRRRAAAPAPPPMPHARPVPPAGTSHRHRARRARRSRVPDRTTRIGSAPARPCRGPVGLPTDAPARRTCRSIPAGSRGSPPARMGLAAARPRPNGCP